MQNIFDAVEHGTLQELKELIASGVDVNIRTDNGLTPLMIAAKRDESTKIINMLIKVGANIDAQDYNGMTALMHAINGNAFSFVNVEALIKAGADVFTETNENKTPLMLAYECNAAPGVIDALKKAEASTERRKKKEFFDAIRNESAQDVERLLNEGADIKALSYNRTPLMTAAMKNESPDIINILVKHGAEVDNKDDDGWTALMFAAHYNPSSKVTEALIQAGADVNVLSAVNRTPLSMAAFNNPSGKVITALVNAGADVNAKNGSGQTPLMEAVMRNRSVEVIEALINAGADVNAKYPWGATILENAQNYDAPQEIIDILKCHGAKLNREEYRSLPLVNKQVNKQEVAVNGSTHVPKTMQSKHSWFWALFWLVLFAPVGLCLLCIKFFRNNSNSTFLDIIERFTTTLVLPVIALSLFSMIVVTVNDVKSTSEKPAAVVKAQKSEVVSDSAEIQVQEQTELIEPISESIPESVLKSEPKPVNEIVKTYAPSNEDRNNPNTEYDENGNVVIRFGGLFYAAAKGTVQDVEKLIADGANVNEIKAVETPLSFAIWYENSIDVIKALIKAGADVNAKLAFDNPLITMVLSDESIEILRILIQSGADVNAVNSMGISPLMAAASSKDSTKEVVKALIAAGANVNAKDLSNVTVLMEAVRKDDRNEAKQIIELLLKAGADVRLKDNTGNNALWYAEDYAKVVSNGGNKEIINILKRAMRGQKKVF